MSAAQRADRGGAARNLLLVAYFYPPCRDTGALRPAALAKWLARLGHRVTVLTTSAYGGDSGANGARPEAVGRGNGAATDRGGAAADSGGAATDRGGVRVVRTADAQLWRARLRGHERVDALFDADTYAGRPHPLSRVLVPEPLVAAWAPFARRRALALNRGERFDCVITSSPPESAHLIGRALQRRGVPWVADVRDAWTFEPLRPPFPTAAQRRLDAWLERRWLGAADAVVCVSEPAAADLRARGIADPVVVRNGWDPDGADRGAGSDATSAAAASPEPAGDPLDPRRVSLVYTGRFGSYGRDPRPLVAGLARLARERPELAERLELVIAGPLSAAERELLGADVSPARIVLAGSLPRERALALQRRADALLLLAQPTRSQLLNIKLFEYLAAGRPILALAAGTEAGRVVAEAGGDPVRADDEAAIAAALARLAEHGLEPLDPAVVAAHTYPAPAERLAAVVERAIAVRASAAPR